MTVLTTATVLFLAAGAGWSLWTLAGPELRRGRGFRALPYHVPADGRSKR